jgi:hypothetical protein
VIPLCVVAGLSSLETACDHAIGVSFACFCDGGGLDGNCCLVRASDTGPAIGLDAGADIELMGEGEPDATLDGADGDGSADEGDGNSTDAGATDAGDADDSGDADEGG